MIDKEGQMFSRVKENIIFGLLVVSIIAMKVKAFTVSGRYDREIKALTTEIDKIKNNNFKNLETKLETKLNNTVKNLETKLKYHKHKVFSGETDLR